MIELNGLTYANRATCPAESVAPELWPYWATIPCLGAFGNDLVDACNKQNLAASDVKAWSPNGIVFGGSSTAQAYTMPSMSYSGDFSIVSVASPSQVSTDGVLASESGVALSSQNWMLWYDVGGAAKGWSAMIADSDLHGYYSYRIVGNNTASGGLNKLSALCMSIQKTEIDLCVDGVFLPYSRYDATFATRGVYTPWIGRNESLLFSGCLALFFVYRRGISRNESIVLSADPLLPFRRRKSKSWFLPLSSYFKFWLSHSEVIQ